MSQLEAQGGVSTENEVIVEERGACGVITLNRPKALHALNKNMVDTVVAMYLRWLQQGHIQRAVMKGEGDRAFCSGGDVKSVVQRAQEGDWKSGSDFFRAEYKMNYLLGRLAIPQVSLLDGVTMGGGAGISMHGPFRVATERTLFAMPECSIGLFPDVGASIFLNRLPRGLGAFLALTGFQLRGTDVLHAGLATHCVPSSRLPELEAALVELRSPDLTHIDQCIRGFEEGVREGESASQVVQLRELGQRYFSGAAAESVASIMAALGRPSAQLAALCADALERMSKNSPLSMRITLRQLQRAQTLSARECFEMEFRLATRCCRGPSDFVEGVRCRLIQRGATPAWRHASVLDVADAEVDAFFAPLDFCDELTADLDAVDKAVGKRGAGDAGHSRL